MGMIHFVHQAVSKNNWKKNPDKTSRMFLVSVMKNDLGGFPRLWGKNGGQTGSQYFLVTTVYKNHYQ